MAQTRMVAAECCGRGNDSTELANRLDAKTGNERNKDDGEVAGFSNWCPFLRCEGLGVWREVGGGGRRERGEG